jgi:DNA-binding transcriptional ArsR family regulator
MNADPEFAVASIAGAIGEPARARMLYSLVDGRARTSTELAAIAGISGSTASVHLDRLRATRLVDVVAQGKHRYYSLAGREVARALESLSVLAGFAPNKFVPNTPVELRAARTCYDHIAGRLGVALHDSLRQRGWIGGTDKLYDVTPAGAKAMSSLGIDIAQMRALRRKFAYPCLDWSERQPHLGGALGAAVLSMALKSRWLEQDADGRSLAVTRRGRRELHRLFGIEC